MRLPFAHAHAKSPWLALLRVGAVVALLIAGFVVAPPATRAATSPLTVVSTWSPTTVPPGAGADYGQKVRVYAEPGSRHLFALGSDGWLAAYDLDSFAPLGGGMQAATGKTSHLPDPVSGGIFFAFADAPFFSTPSRAWIDQFAVVDGQLRKLGTLDVTAKFPGLSIVGMYRAPRTNALWVLATGTNNTGTVIGEIDVSNFAGGGGSVVWTTPPFEGCPFAMHGNPQASVGLGYVARWNALYFGCSNASSGLATSPNSRGAARLVLTSDPAKGPTRQPSEFNLYPLPGDLLKAEAVFDPGSNRLLFPAYTSSTGSTLYVFDTLTNTYVGGVSMGNAEVIQAGVDAVKGRFYGLATVPTVGLIAADTRPTPIRQGITVPAMSRHGGNAPDFSTIAVDPLTSRMFLKYSVMSEIVIVKDEMPAFTPPLPDDTDAATTDVSEEEGKTESTYSGSAQGFGARYRHIGGVEGGLVNFIGFRPGSWPFGAGTREARFSPLDRLTLGNDESTALGITAIVDEGNTQGDLQRTQPRRPDTNEPITERPIAGWPYNQVRCVDLGGTPSESAQPAENTRVTCNAEKGETAAELANTGGDAGGIGVGPTSVKGKSRRDAKLGQVSEVVSIADGISVLGGVLQVGRVETKATAVAKGRPGTAAGTFSRTVQDVKLQGAQLCSGPCGDLGALAAQINTRLQGRVRVEFPTPETLDGSPGGYQSIVQRSRLEQIEQVMLNEQPADRLEVPGMVVYVYQDGARPGRVIGEFAAVQAEARYGISLRDGAIPDITDPPTDSDDFAALGGTGGGPLFGVTPPEGFVTGQPRAIGVDDAGGAIGRAGRLIWNGLRGVGRLLPIWAILLAPIYLSARRWLLLQRSTLTPGGSA
jgi:hypothetical protein